VEERWLDIGNIRTHSCARISRRCSADPTLKVEPM
jgi:hypothetical protein